MRERDTYFYDNGYYTDVAERMLDAERARNFIIVADMDVRNKLAFDHKSLGVSVDLDVSPGIFRSYINEAIQRSRDETGRVRRYVVPRAVYDTVRHRMRYSVKRCREIHEEMQDPAMHYTHLSHFMERGYGVCSHQALACAAMLEVFKTFPFVHGDVSYESSLRFRREDGRPDEYGHAWTRLTRPDGSIIIMDPAQGFYGTLEEGVDVAEYEYRRPEELHNWNAISVGRRAVRGVFNQQTSLY